jgi:hypothetical protein
MSAMLLFLFTIRKLKKLHPFKIYHGANFPNPMMNGVSHMSISKVFLVVILISVTGIILETFLDGMTPYNVLVIQKLLIGDTQT